MPALNFILTGHDALSRVFDRVGDAALRLHRRIDNATTRAGTSVNRFTTDTSTRLSRMQRDTKAGEKALEELKKAAYLLAPAAIPVAASLAPIAAGALTVGAALAAMRLALVPQTAALQTAASAQKKYGQEVAKYGQFSKQASEAQDQYAQTMAGLPPATRTAAAALEVLNDHYKAWSDSLAGDTMEPFTKGILLANALLPKTTGLVKAASTQADRLVTIVGGEMASPGLDRLNSKFTSFAQKTLRSVNDEIVHLLRAGEGKNIGGPARQFMDWARAQGPTVASVLMSVATALVHVLQAGSDVGVGLLQTIEVVARLVSAVPPGAIAAFLQLALALKVTKAAALGLAAGRTVVAQFAAQVLAMQTAAAAAPGRMRALGAAIGAMSRSAKVAVAGTGIGLLILALGELSQRGKQAPPDVDKLTSSLKQLGSTGKVTGEAAKAFGRDLGGLYDKVRSLTDPSTTDKIQQFLVGWTGWDSTPVKDAKANIDSVDKALAGLVQSGQSDLAAAALKRLTAEYGKGGRDVGKFTGQLDDYKSALADAKFEAELTAQSQGLFGAQAQSVQEKLAAQKASADGLRQSLQALNDVQRAGLGGMIGFEAAIDNASKAARENAGALSMSHGQLNLNSEKARNAATALQDLASKTDEAASSARESGSSWETVNGIYTRGRAALIKNAEAMGLSKSQAKALADQILQIPDKTTHWRMDKEDAQRGLEAFNSALKQSPGAKSVTLKTLSGSAEKILESFGYKVTHLKNGSVKITATNGQALGAISDVQGAVNSLHGKTIRIMTEYFTAKSPEQLAAAHGRAKGGPAPKFGAGGMPSGLLNGPGTGTSDSIPMWWASTGEYVINAKSTAKYLGLIEAINADRLGDGVGLKGAGSAVGSGLAGGLRGSVGPVNDAARFMAGAVTAGIKEELQIASPSKKTKALAKDVGAGFISGLTGSRDKIKSVAKDLSNDIKTAFSGKKERTLLKMVDKDTKKLLDLASKRDKLAAKIAEAKTFASDVTKNAREGASLSNLGMDADQVTAGGIKAGLASKLAQIRHFTRYIDILAKKGLNKGLLRQILNMGPEAGYAYASALVGADKATFRSINKLQSQLDSSTNSLGRLGADRLYDSGKNASKGFLAGLESQEKSLEKTMEKLAKSMQKSLKKALGIRSPARVMIPHGVNTARGIAVGVLQGIPHVDQAMRTVAGRMAGRAALAPTAGRAAIVRGAASQIMQVQVDINGATDPIATAREIRRQLLELKRTFGLNVELKVG